MSDVTAICGPCNGIGRVGSGPPLVLDTTGPPVSHGYKKSRLAENARRNLAADVKRMTAEQRLAAFLAHCQLMAQLANAGSAGQHPPQEAASPNAR